MTLEKEALKKIKEIPLKNFHCLSGGKNFYLMNNLVSA